MTTQQLSHLHTALNGLFDQAIREPCAFASNVLLVPCFSRLGSVLPPAGNRHREAFLHHVSVLAMPTTAPPGTPSYRRGPAGAIQSP